MTSAGSPRTAIILAGGLGTRLQLRVADRPKALAPTGQVPFLARQMDWLEQQGIAAVVLAVHHMADQIERYVAHDYAGGLDVSCVREPMGPLGTGGAIKNAFCALDLTADSLVVNGDTLFSFDLAPFVATHRREGTGATMAVTAVDDNDRFGAVELAGGRITGFAERSALGRASFANCGAYMLAPATVAAMPDGAFSLERDFFPQLASANRLAAHVLPRGHGFVDIGTSEAYDAFCRDIADHG
jgi:NDP-sugar pyrophosphorylase family protein